MSYCLNPACIAPTNSPTAMYCQSCGQSLLLAGSSGQRYRSLKCIGSGGFGRTFLATSTAEHQPQNCVIKQLLPHPLVNTFGDTSYNGPDACFSVSYLQRFREEAQRLSELGHHPQIPALFDVIESDGKRNALYLVQEFIAGLTLEKELTQQGPINEQGARSLLSDLLIVLDFIHTHRVIHRDIKPQNIIRPKSSDQNQPDALVLVDFGAAKRTNRAAMARTGTMIGSAGYAAPEQIMGKAVFASDLYSLGVTCAHALTGMHPFDLYSISQDQWIWTQYLVNPISPGLQRILDRLLCRAVNQRYRTAQAVLADLNSLPELSSPLPLPQPSSQPSVPPKPQASSPLSTPISQSPSPSASPSSSLFQRLTQYTSRSRPFPNSAPSPPWLTFTRTKPPSSTPPNSQFPNSQLPNSQLPNSQTPKLPNSQTPKLPNSQTPSAPQLPPLPNFLPWHPTHTLTHHTSSVSALAINPDSTLLASGDRQGNICLWNLEAGTLLHVFPTYSLLKRTGHRDRITDLQFTPDGLTLVSSSADGTLKQWDMAQRQLVTTLEGEGWVMSALTLHPDGHLLISGGANGAIDLWDLTQHQFIQRLWAHQDQISGLELASDGITLFSSSEDGMIYSWDLRTAEAIASIRAHRNGVSALALYDTGQILVSGGGDRTLRLWGLFHGNGQGDSIDNQEGATFKPLQTLSVNLDRVTAIALHPSDTLLANSQDDTHIQLWTIGWQQAADTSGYGSRAYLPTRPRQNLTLNQDWTVTALRFSPRGDRLVSSSADGTIKVWRANG
ncbi:MAG: protein kinase [Cyanobacteria bacterium P01_F01_bin.150]